MEIGEPYLILLRLFICLYLRFLFMKLYRFPYYLILVIAASLAMIFFLKINKKSFYNHYFQEIADIELRNSQALSLDGSLEVFALTELKPVVLSVFWLGLGLLFGIVFRIIPLDIRAEFLPTANHTHVSFVKLVHPTRAP